MLPVLQYINSQIDFFVIVLPEGIEQIPKCFAISWRNNRMLDHADYVITYITHSRGGTAQFARESEKRGEAIYNCECDKSETCYAIGS